MDNLSLLGNYKASSKHIRDAVCEYENQWCQKELLSAS